MPDRHLSALLPVLVALGLVYWPVLGRRDALKMLWLCFMVRYIIVRRDTARRPDELNYQATLYTTPWDNVSGLPPAACVPRTPGTR